MSHYEIYKAYRKMKEGYTKPFLPKQNTNLRIGTILAIGTGIQVSDVIKSASKHALN